MAKKNILACLAFSLIAFYSFFLLGGVVLADSLNGRQIAQATLDCSTGGDQCIDSCTTNSDPGTSCCNNNSLSSCSSVPAEYQNCTGCTSGGYCDNGGEVVSCAYYAALGNQSSPGCSYSSCDEWCNNEQAVSTNECCDDSGTQRQCGDFVDNSGQACSEDQAECSTETCDAATPDSLCCDQITSKQISCSIFTAQISNSVSSNLNGGGGSVTANPPGGTAGGASVSLVNPLGGTTANPAGTITSVPKLIGNIINAALGVVGSLALIMFIYGGFVWMLAAGNEQAVEKGRNILMWAAIGLVVIFASYSLVNFVIAAITKGG
jgi:Type IV secretion system pilin